jgi:hypothetical protein
MDPSSLSSMICPSEDRGNTVSKRRRVRTTTPLLVVTDLERSLDFYTRQVGFGEPGIWGQPPCFAMVHRDGFELMLSLATESSCRRRTDLEGAGTSTYAWAISPANRKRS